MAARFTVTARVGPKVSRERFATLDAALEDLAARLNGIDRAQTRTVFGREYDPAAQVTGRFELRGPDGMRAGIDLRGDGSAEAYTGRIRKRPVERESHETAVQALRRTLDHPPKRV